MTFLKKQHVANITVLYILLRFSHILNIEYYLRNIYAIMNVCVKRVLHKPLLLSKALSGFNKQISV